MCFSITISFTISVVLSEFLTLYISFYFISHFLTLDDNLRLITDGTCGISKYLDAGQHSLPLGAQIIGGVDARPYEFPWQVNISRSRYSRSVNFAIIVSKRERLTDAIDERTDSTSSDSYGGVAREGRGKGLGSLGLERQNED